MMLPLIARLLETPGRTVLVTSGTVTSAELMAKKLPKRAIPSICAVRRPANGGALSLALEARSGRVGGGLKSGRTLCGKRIRRVFLWRSSMGGWGTRSIEGWAKREGFAKQVFGCFDLILPADAQTAKGLSQFVDAPLSSVGNLKYDAPALTFDAAERDALKSAIGERPVWVAASVHAEEMDVFIDAQKEIGKDALLVLVPRHPGDASSRMLLGAHPTLNFAQRSKRQKPSAKTDIYLCDTLGEMGSGLRARRSGCRRRIVLRRVDGA